MIFKSIDLGTLDRASAYKLFLTAIVPRPIGWISTISKHGIPNAAPFSWFNSVCGDPPMVMVAVGRRKGEMKDTARNIRDTGEFVVHIVSESCAAAMVQSSADYPPEVNEFEAAGLTPIESQVVKPDRIAESPIHFECKLEQMLVLGNNAIDLIIGRCLMAHVAQEVLAPDGLVNVLKLRPMARLGRDEYTVVKDLMNVSRP